MHDIVKIIAKHKELALVGLILCVLAMIIVPIPHWLMDILIAVNIGLTIIVLMVVLYIHTTLEFTSFPSVLLVLALFRIGITISTSRLILLDGDAGQIISTFGEFVVGGNLVVGIIIFSIITLINFIVITKGSERVAEVAARFSLDAMPGKQMSIDSDLRAGNIQMEEAQRRRNALVLESKLYGAMDGAMKFVKGDAIASIIDILINLIGGLVVGTVQNSMSFSEALHKYSILTVGDGLVQQVPSLLISVTAGMMSTRVSDDDSKLRENLGSNIINQIFNNPKALLSSSVLFLLMACIPGMPSLVFCVLFAMLLGFAVYLFKRQQAEPAAGDLAMDSVIEESGTDKTTVAEDFVSWKLQALILNLSANLKGLGYGSTFKDTLIEVQRDVLTSLGVEIPQIVLRYTSSLPDYAYQLLVFEVPVATGKFMPDSILLTQVNNEIKKVLSLDVVTDSAVNLGFSETGAWISQEYSVKCDEYGINYLRLPDFLLLHIGKLIKAHIAEFLGMQEVKNLLDKMIDYQDLIKELLRMLPLNKITEILQRLLAEGISIRNFKIILDAMLEWAQREKEVVIITEYVRQALGRYIAHKYSNGTLIISCFIVDSDIEDMIRDAIRFNERGSYLALDPYVASDIVEHLRTLYSEQQHLQIAPVVLTAMDVRRYLRSIIEKDLPYLQVLSFQEVEAHAQFNSLGVVEL